MNISSVSPSIAAQIAPATVNKSPASAVQQASKPVAPPAVKSAADRDGDQDGSGGGISVRA
jgi:hypothetical protein